MPKRRHWTGTPRALEAILNVVHVVEAEHVLDVSDAGRVRVHVHVYVPAFVSRLLGWGGGVRGVPYTTHHPPPVTLCPVLATSCSSFSLSVTTGHVRRGQPGKDHSSKAVRWKIWKTGALAIITLSLPPSSLSLGSPFFFFSSQPEMQQAATL